MITITLFMPGEGAITYIDPTNVNVDRGGVLSFYWTQEISGNAQRIVTTVPFVIKHDIKIDQGQHVVKIERGQKIIR